MSQRQFRKVIGCMYSNRNFAYFFLVEYFRTTKNNYSDDEKDEKITFNFK